MNIIHATTEFNNYCGSRSPLRQLTTIVAPAKRYDTELNKLGVPLQSTDRVFIDARLLAHVVYQLWTFCVPLKYSPRYLLDATATHVKRTRVTFSIPLLDLAITLTPSAVAKWIYSSLETDPPYPDPMVRITPDFLNLHPSIRTAALPVDYQDLPAAEANALLDPYDQPPETTPCPT